MSEGFDAFCLGVSAFLGLRISLLLRRWLLAMCFSNSACWKELHLGRSWVCWKCHAAALGAHLLRRAKVIKREPLDLAWDDMAPKPLTHLLCAVARRTDQMSAAAGKRLDVADAHAHLRADFCHPRFGQRRVHGAAQARALG